MRIILLETCPGLPYSCFLFDSCAPSSLDFLCASFMIDTIQWLLTGGKSTLLFASNTVSGRSVLSLTVSDITFGKYSSSSCIDPESVISAQQWPLSRNSTTFAYSFQSGVIRNLCA